MLLLESNKVTPVQQVTDEERAGVRATWQDGPYTLEGNLLSDSVEMTQLSAREKLAPFIGGKDAHRSVGLA